MQGRPRGDQPSSLPWCDAPPPWRRYIRPNLAAPRQESGGACHVHAASSSHAGATTQLRVLRQGPGPGRSGRDDLHLRVHLLPRLRRDEPVRGLSQLRRRLQSPSDPPTRGPEPPSRVHGPRTRARLRAGRTRVLVSGDGEPSRRSPSTTSVSHPWTGEGARNQRPTELSGGSFRRLPTPADAGSVGGPTVCAAQRRTWQRARVQDD
jgi:hypothetical protein